MALDTNVLLRWQIGQMSCWKKRTDLFAINTLIENSAWQAGRP